MHNDFDDKDDYVTEGYSKDGYVNEKPSLIRVLVNIFKSLWRFFMNLF